MIYILHIPNKITIYNKKMNTNKEKNIKYLDGVDIIYWINLERAKERREYMENLLKDDVFIDMQCERFKAVDAKTTNVRNKFELIDDITSINNRKTDAEYACLLSHLETIRKFSETDHNVALIFEDDLSLEYKKYWMKTIKEIINNAPKDWEIIKLTSFSGHRLHKLYTLWKPYLTFKPVNRREKSFRWKSNYWDVDFSSAAYLINNKGAKKLINELYHNNKYVLDNKSVHQADIIIYEKLKTYVYKYPYFTYRNNNNYSFILGNAIEAEKGRYKKKKITNDMYKELFSHKKTRKNKIRKNKTRKNKTRN